MLRRLRLKFVALNMATVAVVLAVVFTAICVINYQQGTNGVYSALDAAIDHAGDAAKMPPASGVLGPQGATSGNAAAGAGVGGDAAGSAGGPDAGGVAGSSDDSPATGAGAAGGAFSGMTPPEIGGRRAEGESVIPVVVYALEDDGGMTVVPSSTTASIADDVLSDAASAVLQKGEGSGFLDAFGLFYSKRAVGGTTFVAFADASAASSWQSLALTLAAVGVGALAVFLVISVFFSRWALGPVARAWDQQQRFVADASHELKTPLTVILANTSILRAHPERSVASQSQWIESTQSEAERMQELVRDMLDLAGPEHAETVREHARVDLTDLVEGGLLQFESVAFERNVSLASDIDRDVSVTGDASSLRRLVTTLLDNACKYVEEGGRIAVTLRQTARRIELHVHNTGTVIAEEDLPHVFDRFYRADKARTRSEGSYGLGLAIAREITEEHGGTITATSDETNGTTFTVTLPLRSS